MVEFEEGEDPTVSPGVKMVVMEGCACESRIATTLCNISVISATTITQF